jgi:hypothetical protein
MAESKEARNKALVLKAFDTLFNKRDYEAAERYWSPNYIQHSAHIEPGRDGLFNLIRNAPHTLGYEHQLAVALSAAVERVYPLDQFKEAFEQSLKPNRSGKIVFKFGAH